MTLDWLADALRDAGLVVIEHSGWRTRRAPGDWQPRYGVVHATAAPVTQDDSVQVRVVRDGRTGLPGPIANAAVDRLGRWHVLAAGRCNTTTVGTAGPFEGWGNTYALSVEGCNDNLSEPWPPVQYDAYVRGWAAWCRRLGWDAGQLVGHKEHTPGRKSDPTFSMDRFRADVARVLSGDEGGNMTDRAEDTIERLRDEVLSPAKGFSPGAGKPAEGTITGLRHAAYAVVVGNETSTWLGREVAAMRAKLDQLAAAPAAVIDYDQLADAIVRRALAAAGAAPAAGEPTNLGG